MVFFTVNNGYGRRRQTGRQTFSFRVIDLSSVRVEKRLTDYGVVVVPVFGEPLLGLGLQIELDISLFEEVVVGLITCGGVLVVLGTGLLGGRAHGFNLLIIREDEEQKKVLEAEDDEDKVDGEVEERVTQRAHETWR